MHAWANEGGNQLRVESCDLIILMRLSRFNDYFSRFEAEITDIIAGEQVLVGLELPSCTVYIRSDST